MKKRIFAASMASVMALSSVSVVAFADETNADFGEAVTKAELKEYIKTAEKFAEDKLDDFGTNQSEQFEDALEAARVVADNPEASAVDVVATYQMLKGVWNNLNNYTFDDLKSLVSDNKGIYDKDNALNEDDKDYDEAKYKVFQKAYENAEDLVNDATNDQCAINDAYVDLEDAVKNLKKKNRVTKSEFRSAYNEFIDLVNSFSDYEGWRRGTATVGADLVYVKSGEEDKKYNFKGETLTFDEIIDIVYGNSDDQGEKTKAKATTDGYSVKTNATMLKIGLGTSTVSDFAKAAYDQFVTNAKYNVTTNSDINNAYDSMKKAVKIFNGWEADGNDRGSNRSCNNLLDTYHDKIVKEIGKDSTQKALYNDAIDALVAQVTKGSTAPTIVFDVDGALKVEDADAKVDNTKKVYLDPETNKINFTWDAANTKWTYTAATTTSKYIVIEAGDDLTKYVPFNVDSVASILDADVALDAPHFSDAYKSLVACEKQDAAKADVRDYSAAVEATIDSNDTLTDKSAKTAAYALVNRALKYALEDNFPADDATYTKKDIAKLIKDAEKLIDETGDSAKFMAENIALDTARKAAIAWVAAANACKTYEDGKTLDDVGYAGTLEYTDSTDIDSDVNSTDVYNHLKKQYDALNDEFVKFPVSFGEIAESVAAIAEGLEDGIYGASSETIAKSLELFARDLSVLDYSKDSEAFDDDRVYMYYNRLDTKDGSEGEKTLYADYLALLKAVEDAKKSDEPEVIIGDFDGDGKITAQDALAVLKAYANQDTLTDAQKKAGDYNKDGIVDAKDALAILKAFAGVKE